MPARRLSRRRLVALSAATLTGLTGCSSQISGSKASTTATGSTPTETPPTSPAGGDGPVTVADLSVTDFLLYLLSGTHPHVHNREGIQYVVVRTRGSVSTRTVRNGLTLELNGESVPLAARQPVPWQHDTDDVAFAVPKADTFDAGRVLFEHTALRSLSEETLTRLNQPPVFEVSTPSVSPAEIRPDEQTTATVRVTLTNTGRGRGTFGASLSGNFVSGSNSITATLDTGTDREITGSVPIIGESPKATVRLDWGVDQWAADIPVVDSASPSK